MAGQKETKCCKLHALLSEFLACCIAFRAAIHSYSELSSFPLTVSCSNTGPLSSIHRTCRLMISKGMQILGFTTNSHETPQYQYLALNFRTFFLFVFFIVDLALFGCAGSSLPHGRFLELRCMDLSGCRAWALGTWVPQLWRRVSETPRHAGSSRIRDRTRVPRTGRRILNHGTTREVPGFNFSVSLADNQAKDNKRQVYQPLILERRVQWQWQEKHLTQSMIGPRRRTEKRRHSAHS